MRFLIILLTSLWPCFGFSQKIAIPNLQSSFVVPNKWTIKENFLDFDFVLLSPFNTQKSTRSTIGILTLGKANFAKFVNDTGYLDDFQSQKKKWVLKHGGTFNYTKFRKVANTASSIIESSFSISNVHYLELVFFYFCRDKSLQIKGVFPHSKDADIKVFDSFIKKSGCLTPKDKNDDH